MLSIIDQKGPVTNAIFSKCASWEDCLALKEKLNSGEHVDWETTCPVLVATVLKVGKLLVPCIGISLPPRLSQAVKDQMDSDSEEQERGHKLHIECSHSRGCSVAEDCICFLRIQILHSPSSTSVHCMKNASINNIRQYVFDIHINLIKLADTNLHAAFDQYC